MVGVEAAATLMGSWPRDPARVADVEILRTDLRAVEHRLDAKMGANMEVTIERIARSEEHLISVMRGELNAQVRSMVFGFVGLQAAIGGFVIALLRFGI